MKKIFSYAMLLLAGTFVMTSCDDDNDSNPTLTQPTEFVLNTPAVESVEVDLEQSSAIELTWSQPENYTDLGAPLAVTYVVQMSPDGTFNKVYDANADDNTGADYVQFDDVYTTCEATIDAATLNKALIQIKQWDAENVPSTAKAYFRVRAVVLTSVGDEKYPIYSNVVSLNTIPYYVELKPADPEIWWILGSEICDGSWGSEIGANILPLQTIEGISYDAATGQGTIQWVGYLTGAGFKLRGSLTDGWLTQWGQGDSFGEYKKNDGGSGNITVPAAGYYTVVLDTKNDVLTVSEYGSTPTVYDGMSISGSFNGWSDTEMNPCHTYDGAINHDWYIVQEFAASDEVKIKQTGSWDFNRGGTFVTYGEGMYAYGVQNGDNLVIPEAGTYIVLFNDITGYIRFIKQ